MLWLMGLNIEIGGQSAKLIIRTLCHATLTHFCNESDISEPKYYKRKQGSLNCNEVEAWKVFSINLFSTVFLAQNQ